VEGVFGLKNGADLHPWLEACIPHPQGTSQPHRERPPWGLAAAPSHANTTNTRQPAFRNTSLTSGEIIAGVCFLTQKSRFLNKNGFFKYKLSAKNNIQKTHERHFSLVYLDPI